jgi:glyoxylase-like metal-dependent hydrolase (beta-lactamase superfamily II)
MIGRPASPLRAPRWVVAVLLLTGPAVAAGRSGATTERLSSPTPGSPAPAAEVYAVRYGTLRDFPVAALIAGADTARRLDVALMVWVLKLPGGRTALVDAGFYRQKFLDQWKPDDYQRPSEAIRLAGVQPEDVTDVIVTHVHWDHLDGVDLFPNARVWIQRDEYEHHVDEAGRPRDPAIDSADAAMLRRLRQAGRVMLVDGDGRELFPGATVYTGGRHTFASQYVGVRTARGVVVVASDNAYLYENLERHRPIAQTLDSVANLRAQARMSQLAATPRLIVPGHDPAVFRRFPEPGRGVAKIE